jgi:hypothetical protein
LDRNGQGGNEISVFRIPIFLNTDMFSGRSGTRFRGREISIFSISILPKSLLAWAAHSEIIGMKNREKVVGTV